MRCGLLILCLVGSFESSTLPTLGSDEPTPLVTMHGYISVSQFTLYPPKHRKWWQRIPHPSINQLNNFNTVSGAVLTGVQLYWMFQNWHPPAAVKLPMFVKP